ncbi:MAG TPA: orotidine-5'-phosphate decarboxylase [Elusimicrobiota bacterium]|nr:orotidine-5'-phosphate decarboxylase [Elusimicrobiota bacterium]
MKTMTRPKKDIIVALDGKTVRQDKDLVMKLGSQVRFYKVSPGLYFKDPTIVRWLKQRGKKIFLDFKWYDIPSQVKRSVEAAARLGVDSCTVHLSAGRDVLRAALSARPRPLIWGVSVLTSFSDRDLRDVGVSAGVRKQVLRLARLARREGLDGMVCSPLELPLLKKFGLTLVTPGIRWGKVSGTDQKRVSTPQDAWKNGADFVVMGRSILEARDPARAVRDIRKAWKP